MWWTQLELETHFLEGSLWVSVVSVLCRRGQEGENVSFVLELV